MSKKLLIILISAFLAVASVSVTLVIVLNNNGKGGGGTSSSQSSTSSSSSNNQQQVVEAADRSQYKLTKIAVGYSKISVYDLLVGYGDPQSDYAQAVDGLVEGYTIGDIYNQIIELGLAALENNEQIGGLGIDLEALVGDFMYYYGVDGNWYSKLSKTKTNELLNKVLSYKIDGTGELKLNLNTYGSKTLAYIFFDYVEGSTGADKNMIIGALMQSSPIVEAMLNMTLNQLITLIDGTTAQRVEAINQLFADLKLEDVTSLIGVEVGENAVASATLSITVGQITALLGGEAQDINEFITTAYAGITLGDAMGLTPESTGFIDKLHTISYADYIISMGEGTTSQLILDNAGDVTLGQLFTAYMANIESQNDYTAFLTEHAAIFEANLQQAYTKFSEIDLGAYLIYGANGNVDGYDFDTLYEHYKTELDLIKSAYEDFVEINAVTVDEALVTITGKTLAEIESQFNNYVDLYKQTQSAPQVAEKLIDDIYAAHTIEIDEFLSQYGKTYAGIKAVVKPYIQSALTGYESTGDFKSTLGQVLQQIYQDYKTEIDAITVNEFGLTLQEILDMVNSGSSGEGGSGGIEVNMDAKTFFEVVVLGYLVGKLPEGELINFKSILGDTLVITSEDVYYLYDYGFSLVPDPDAFDQLLEELFGGFKIGSLLDLVISYMPVE